MAHPDFWQRQQELIALIKDLRMFSPASLPLIELGEDALIETSRYRDRMQRIEAKVQALKAPCVCSR